MKIFLALPGTVLAFGVVSLLTDFSMENISTLPQTIATASSNAGSI